MTASAAQTQPAHPTSFYPLLFVLLWSTGFIGAKFGLPDAEPLTFLSVRYLIVLVLMAGIASVMKAPWPATASAWLHIGVSGLLVHGVYLGGVFTAIAHGLPAGVTALVVGLQPILTALGAGTLLGERVEPRQWMGLALGFVGVGLVVAHKVIASASHDGLVLMLVPAVVALAITLCATTSPTPTKPSARPIHCRGSTRSPSSVPAPSAVRMGCSPTTSAVTPAGRPWAMAVKTPPRYTP